MRLLVTGERGQLARSLAERSREWPEIELLLVGRSELDMEIPGSAAAAVQRHLPDIVLNAAAYTDVDRAEEEPLRAMRVNGEAAGEIAEAAKKAGAPIIQISTDYVFDGSHHTPYREDAEVSPLGAYGRSKLAGEDAVRAATSDHLIVRTAWLYSPFGHNFVRSIFNAAEQQDELRVVADAFGSPTSAHALAGALFSVADRWRTGDNTGRGDVYHLAGSGQASWYDLACEVLNRRADLGLSTAALIPISAKEWPSRVARPSYSVLDTSKFEQDFEIRLPEWRESVGATVGRLAAGMNRGRK